MVSKNYLWVHNLRFLLSGIFLFFSFNIYSQEPLKIKKITGGINFDGIPDEKIWQEVTPLPLVMHVPVYGIEPTEKTIERIAYDDENLYLSGIFYYTDPGMIRAVSKKRDTWIARCDWMCIIIDTFNDKENGVAFFTNPNGLRTDATVKNDAVGGDKDINKTWNTFWDVKTNIFSDGWSAEFRIPLSSLRFQIKEGKTTMGLLVFRYISSKSELSTFPAVSQDFGSYAFWKPSLFSEILFEELKPVKPFYITPYATSGLTQIGEINQQKTGYHMKTTPKFDAGLDVKYSITNNLTTDLTINTDFAQVEADDQQINLSRFSLYFPEKRVFFQEKADVFDFSFTNTIEGDNLFYSRRIGIYDGHPVRIYGGLRLTGSINDWAIGIVDMQTAPVENNPGENFGAFRTKRRIINQNSFIGGMVTSRLGMNGSYNIAYGLDGLFRVAGDEYLTLKLAQTFENGASNKIFEKSPSRFLLEWKRRNERGFSYDLVYSYSGENFNPGIGFESRENYQSFKGILQYGWFPGNNSFIKDHKISLTGHSIQSSIDQSMESAKGTLAWQFNAKKGFGGIITGTWFFEELTDTLFLGNNQASVPAGSYEFSNIKAQYNTSSRHDFSSTYIAEIGSFFDGWKVSLSTFPSLSIGSDVILFLTYKLDLVNFQSRDMWFTNHIFGIRGELAMTTKTSLLPYIQYNTSIDKIITNLRFRYNPKEGNDFYLVYDEGLNTNISREIPRLSFSSGRTLLLKYTYTFRL